MIEFGCAIWEDFKEEGEFVPGPERAIDCEERGTPGKGDRVSGLQRWDDKG